VFIARLALYELFLGETWQEKSIILGLVRNHQEKNSGNFFVWICLQIVKYGIFVYAHGIFEYLGVFSVPLYISRKACSKTSR